jgi:hypothetical protein
MNTNPAHVIIQATTVRAKANLKAATLVRYASIPGGTTPVLGVVLFDCKEGDLASVGVKGQYQVQVAPGVTLAPGDPMALNAQGQGIAGTPETKVATVFEFVPTLATIIL